VVITFSDPRTRWRLRRRLCALVVALIVGSVLVACSSTTGAQPATPAGAANGFLSRYVDANGRVVRRDQGGDTVSEGQGYAMLLAVATGNRGRFATIWDWTRQHLTLPTHLFAWHWSGGHRANTSAADADLQIGWALALAGRRWHSSAWTDAARTVGKAIATSEIGYDDAGAPTLVAGPWAVGRNAPNVVEPGYWTPPAEQTLAALTGDKRLEDVTNADLGHLGALTNNGQALPPDWAQLGGGTDPHPVPAPDGSAPVQSGPDGLRALVWTACTSAGRQLAARWWPLVRHDAGAAPLSRNLDGSPRQHDLAALSAVAAAAAASSAGDTAARTALLTRASEIDAKYPTYYGAAWVALGRILLTTDWLGHC
jgi:endo-1,4-beta-D-glucanase Y